MVVEGDLAFVVDLAPKSTELASAGYSGLTVGASLNHRRKLARPCGKEQNTQPRIIGHLHEDSCCAKCVFEVVVNS